MVVKPKTKARSLKVYWAEIDGLNDWVVAAHNRSEALEAFGVRQDLFAQGEAGDASHPATIDAARASPLTPLRRPKGSAEPFAPATGVSDWSAAIPKAPAAHAPARSTVKAEAAETKPKPDRRPLDRAKARLADVEDLHRDTQKRLAEDRARLDERQAREDADYAQEIAAARQSVAEAKQAFNKAGGG